MTRFTTLMRGDPAPWFRQRSASQPIYVFDSIAGRYVVLLFFGSAGDGDAQAALAAIAKAPETFNDMHASFFGVSNDPGDEPRLVERQGVRFILDFDKRVARLYGAAAEGDAASRRLWIVLDPQLRVLHAAPFDELPARELIALVAALPPPASHGGMEVTAPILHLPSVFEAELCHAFTAYYDAHGGQESGVMRERGGKTVLVLDPIHKRRRDCIVGDPGLIAAAQQRVRQRIVPEIAKAHQFHVTRMERYLVGCYSAEHGGHFRAHRDNTTAGTAHRRFAVSINLNDDFEGGDISFPEFSPRGYKPKPGAAIVFSCSLLHKVSEMVRGRRFAFLPFLYDDAAAELRERNKKFLDTETSKSGGL